MSQRVNYITIISPAAATGTVAEIYAQMQRDLRSVPEPMTLHSPNPEVLAGAWSLLRETLVSGQVRRGLKEAVAASVAQINACPWCVDVHGFMLRVTGDGQAATALQRRRLDTVQEARLRTLMTWAAATRTPSAAILQAPPFRTAEAPEVIGTAVTFHYLTRMVNALLVETWLPHPRLTRAVLPWIAPWLRGAVLNDAAVPGASLGWLPPAALPVDLGWAAANPAVAGAVARFAATLDRHSARIVPPPLQALVTRHVEQWDGADPGLGRSWLNEAVEGLDGASQAQARLALLAALASSQIDAATVQAFRRQQPADDALVVTLAWASFAAARRIGRWLWQPPAAAAATAGLRMHPGGVPTPTT